MNFEYSASVSDLSLPSGWSALNCQFMVIFIVLRFSKSYFCSFHCSLLWIFGSAFEACRVESDASALDSFELVSPVASRELRSTTPTASVANRDAQLPPQTSTCFRKIPTLWRSHMIRRFPYNNNHVISRRESLTFSFHPFCIFTFQRLISSFDRNSGHKTNLRKYIVLMS